MAAWLSPTKEVRWAFAPALAKYVRRPRDGAETRNDSAPSSSRKPSAAVMPLTYMNKGELIMVSNQGVQEGKGQDADYRYTMSCYPSRRTCFYRDELEHMPWH